MSSAVYSRISGSGIADGIEERDQATEGLALAVVRRGGGEQHGVATAGQQPGQPVGQVALGDRGAGNVVGLVDDHRVPAGVLEEVAVAADVLEGVDGDDDAVVDLEGVLVGRDAQAQLGDARGVQPHERDVEAVPQLRLELGEHGLAGEHQDAVAAAAPDQLGEDHPHLDGLAEADRVGEQQPRAELVEGEPDRVELELHGAEDAEAFEVGLEPGRRHLAELGFQEELRLAVARTTSRERARCCADRPARSCRAGSGRSPGGHGPDRRRPSSAPRSACVGPSDRSTRVTSHSASRQSTRIPGEKATALDIIVVLGFEQRSSRPASPDRR